MHGTSRSPDSEQLHKRSDSLDSLSRIERTQQRLWILALLLLLLVSLGLLMVDAALHAAERLLFGMKDVARQVLDEYGTAVALLTIVLLACAYLYEKLLMVRDRNRELVEALDANARLLALRSHQLDTWDRLSHQLITNFNLPRLLELIARTAADVTDSDCAAVILSDQDSPHLRLAAIHRRGMETELARKAAAKVIATGEPIDLRFGSLPDDFDRPDLEWEELIGVAATPLLAADTIRGALLVGRLAPAGPLAHNVTDVLASFGSQASIALEKAHLYAESQRQLQRLAGLLEELRRADDRRQASATTSEGKEETPAEAASTRTAAQTRTGDSV
jgi:hypothetical protein